jgi:hypothetical protein
MWIELIWMALEPDGPRILCFTGILFGRGTNALFWSVILEQQGFD